MPASKKTYEPLSPAYVGIELRRCELDGDSARAIQEAAELASEVTRSSISAFGAIHGKAAGIVRYALSLLADELERMEDASDADRRAFVDRLFHHFQPRKSRAKLEEEARKREFDRRCQENLDREREIRERREAAEEAVRAEEEVAREARVQEKLAAASGG